ncbi:MAG: AAA family ATPase [Ignavibacteria bacterium]|nr:AAA family ATPase [Ignavibacteria bacterium]
MKIKTIEAKNYRLLNDFSLNLEDDLSLIIGKNNTGKTSLLRLLQKFLSSTTNSFYFDDFSIACQKDIIEKIENKEKIVKTKYNEQKLELKVFIERSDEDNLANISDLILDLDSGNRILLLSFEYALDFESFEKLKADFKDNHIKNACEFLHKQHKAYFKIKRKVIDINDENNFLEIEDAKIQKILNIQSISAKRDVLNEEGDSLHNNRTLSKLSYRYFKPFENSQAPHVIDLQKELIKADGSLTKSYANIFSQVTKDVERFSYNGSKISVKSNFQEVNLLKENTSVVYDEKGFELPEDYNGLGYLNLFAMIFELHIIFDEFKKTHLESEQQADINLLFIEEPEAHTHPQMQYVFIRNIRQFLSENKGELNLQTIITTHSAHITSQSDFSKIKYFLNKDGRIEVKNLSNLESNYGESAEGKANYKFLKQYLTLHKAELFFSDKIIFIEGDTERILLPAMMKKVDKDNANVNGYVPLLSQKISIVDVGAHSKVFDKLLKFLEIKTLIITDLDSVKDNGNGKMVACPVQEGINTSNSSIKHFLQGKSWTDLINLPDSDRVMSHGDTEIHIAYQTRENNYHARSFEDAFASLNLTYIKNNKNNFDSLKSKNELDIVPPDYYKIANSCIEKKTEFAADILYNSSEDFSDWKIPSYINKGLLWLSKI